MVQISLNKEIFNMSKQAVTFQEALEFVESLPEYQQENMLDIILHRLIAHRRQSLAKHIEQARQEYAKGQVRKGSVADLMKEVSNCDVNELLIVNC